MDPPPQIENGGSPEPGKQWTEYWPAPEETKGAKPESEIPQGATLKEVASTQGKSEEELSKEGDDPVSGKKGASSNSDFERQDGWSENFTEVRSMGVPPWPNAGAFDFVRHVTELQHACVAVVLDVNDLYARYAAEALARHWQPTRDCRTGSYSKWISYGLDEIISKFLTKPPSSRCLVMEASGIGGAKFLKRHRRQLDEAIKKHRDSGFKLLLWMTHCTQEDLDAVAGISVIELPRDIHHRSDAPARTLLDADYYRRLFGGGLQRLMEVIESRNQLIEQQLVRAVVLFGGLAPEHLEKVMSQALAGVELRPPAESRSRTPIPALGLWESNRRHFQDLAGLVLVAGRMDFASAEEREAATVAAWEDGAGMSAFFHRLDAAELLLTRDRDADALVRAFVDGVAGLTMRMPGSLGTDWLRALSMKYSEREGATTAAGAGEEATTWKSTLKSILQMLRGDRERRLHLYDRLGRLCLNLPERVAESFLEDLIENGACLLAWRLCVELRGSGANLGRFIRRILVEEGDFDHDKKGNDLPPQILRDAATLSTRMVGDALELHAAFYPMLPGPESKGETLPAQCALLLPVFCIRQLGNLDEMALPPAMARLVEGLSQPLGQNGTTTQADYWCRALSDPRLSRALQDCDNRKGEDWRAESAAVLFSLANLAAMAGGTVAEELKPLLVRIKSNVPAAEWRKARERWLDIRAYAMWCKTKTPITPKTGAERRMHLNAMAACNRLIGL